MFQLRLIIRNFLRHPVFTLVSLAGLMVGLTSTLLIGIYLMQESSYDHFHPNAEKIYQLYTIYKDASRSEKAAHLPLPMDKALKDKLGEEMTFTSLWHYTYPGVAFKTKDREMDGMDGYSTDPNFFKLFNFPLLYGNPDHLLDEPYTVVLTQSGARKLFGKENALGEVFSIDTLAFKVTGILKDLPGNTQFRFDLLFAENVRYVFYPNFDQRWWEGGITMYALVNNSGDLQRLQTQLSEIKENELSPEFRSWFDFNFQALKGTHLDNTLTQQNVPPVTRSHLRSMFFIALSVLIIACFNFIIFSISLAEDRYRDTGIAKVVGASRWNLWKQAVLEGILLSLLAVYLAFILGKILLPWFSRITGSNISGMLSDPRIIGSASMLAIIIGLLVSLYPALYISRFSIVESLALRSKRGANHFLIRQILLVVQLFISITLLTSEGFMIRQLHYMMQYDLGYDAANLYSVDLTYLDRDGRKRYEEGNRFIGELTKKGGNLGLDKATITENIPGFYFQNQFKVSDEKGDQNNHDMVITSIDENFMDVYGIKLLEGKNFTPGENTSYYNAILNESAMVKLGWKSTSGKTIQFHYDPTPITITGLFKDIHINSLQYPIEPVVYRYETNNFPGFVTFRLRPDSKQKAVLLIKQTWEKLFPETIWNGFFVTEKYNEKYGDEKKLISIIGSLALLSVILALAGVIALIAFIVTKRTKEAGIRKVHGASSGKIVVLFASPLVAWIIIGFAAAVPLTWYLVRLWLQQYPYHINLSWWIFPLSGIIVLLLCLAAISIIIYRIAHRNPTHALRYE